jgi:hypothetical protein
VVTLGAVFHDETFDTGEFVGLWRQDNNVEFDVGKVLT